MAAQRTESDYQALGLEDGIMQKAHRGSVLTREQIERNKRLSKTRYVIEQSFGTLHRKFKHKRA
ncbi:transposase, partial [Oligella urethralis]|uniref:transposase n=1 Tax=Oligella urethralis TaxID=90245 RepID=UPI0039C9E1D9